MLIIDDWCILRGLASMACDIEINRLKEPIGESRISTLPHMAV